MSGSEDDDGPGTREVAHRLFAAEFDDSDLSYSESDEERAPNYVITPSGARVNRLFLVGVLTETEWVNDDMLRARVVDPTGAFVAYAGQYQPDELAFLERVDAPAFLAVTGKARTFQPEDSDRVFTSVRPESISEVDADTRDRWVVEAARRTIDRVEAAAAALDTGLAGEELTAALEADGIDPALASGIALALDHYGTTPAYLGALDSLAEAALEMVAGERDEVGGLDLAPGEGGGNAAALAGDSALDAGGTAESQVEPADATDPPTGSEFDPVDEGSRVDTEASDETALAGASGSDPTATSTDTGDSDLTAATASTADSDEETDAVDEDTVGEFDTGDTDGGVGTDDTSDDGSAADASASEADDNAFASDDVGDFNADDPNDFGTSVDSETDDPGDFDPDEDVLSEAEREQIESEYGTDFSTGDEVEPEPELEPEVDDTDSETAVESGVESDSGAVGEPETQSDPEPDASTDAGSDAKPTADDATDLALDEAVMDAMSELSGGDGVDRDELVDTVTDRTGASDDEVASAIEDALMSGQCYEPEDGVLKPI